MRDSGLPEKMLLVGELFVESGGIEFGCFSRMDRWLTGISAAC